MYSFYIQIISMKEVKKGHVLEFEWVIGKTFIKTHVKDGFFEVIAFKLRF